MSSNIYDGIAPRGIIRMDKESEEVPVFEAPIWAHGRMRKMGLDPQSLDDWSLFKEYCK